MSLVVYADFGSPACYLASQRTDALTAAGVPVDWRAVETDPRLPVGGRRVDKVDGDRLERELQSLASLVLPGEEVPQSLPGFRPNTRGAVSGYAEAYVAGVADDVRRLLFDAYWMRGADIEQRRDPASPTRRSDPAGDLVVGALERVRLRGESESRSDHDCRLATDP